MTDEQIAEAAAMSIVNRYRYQQLGVVGNDGPISPTGQQVCWNCRAPWIDPYMKDKRQLVREQINVLQAQIRAVLQHHYSSLADLDVARAKLDGLESVGKVVDTSDIEEILRDVKTQHAQVLIAAKQMHHLCSLRRGRVLRAATRPVQRRPPPSPQLNADLLRHAPNVCRPLSVLLRAGEVLQQ